MPASEASGLMSLYILSDIITSLGESLDNSIANLALAHWLVVSSPVDISTQAMAPSDLTSEKANKKLLLVDSSRLSSVRVPAVTSLTTSRFTTDFGPLFFASIGLSICSHTATLKPCVISSSR